MGRVKVKEGRKVRPNPELKVETARVDELIPYAGNAKLHPRQQVDQIAASIAEFGNCDPIAVWHNDDGDMEIVEGHGRLMALNKLGIETFHQRGRKSDIQDARIGERIVSGDAKEMGQQRNTPERGRREEHKQDTRPRRGDTGQLAI